MIPSIGTYAIYYGEELGNTMDAINKCSNIGGQVSHCVNEESCQEFVDAFAPQDFWISIMKFAGSLDEYVVPS